MKLLKDKKLSNFLMSGALATLALGLSACGSSPMPFHPPVGGMGVGGFGGMPGQGPFYPGPVPGVCYPLNAPIPFTATNAFLNTNTVKLGLIPGSLPQTMINQLPGYPVFSGTSGMDPYPTTNIPSTMLMNGSIGGVALTGFGAKRTNMGINIKSPYRVDGSIELNVNSMAGANNWLAGSGIPASITGTITISPNRALLIASQSQSIYPFQMTSPSMLVPQMPTYTQPCVSRIGVSVGYSTPMGTDASTVGGRVFLWLNGTAHGSWLQL